MVIFIVINDLPGGLKIEKNLKNFRLKAEPECASLSGSVEKSCFYGRASWGKTNEYITRPTHVAGNGTDVSVDDA